METFLVFYVKHKGIKCFMDSSSTFIILWPLNRICLLTSTRYEVIKKQKSHCVLLEQSFYSQVFVCLSLKMNKNWLYNFKSVLSVYVWTGLVYTSKLFLALFFICLNFQKIADYTNVVSLRIGILLLLTACFEEVCLFHFLRNNLKDSKPKKPKNSFSWY